MKWIILWILLAGYTVGLDDYTEESPVMASGGNVIQRAWTIIARWPIFSNYFQREAKLTVNITSPEDGTTYYSNSTLPVNATLTRPSTCTYRIDDNAENTLNCTFNNGLLCHNDGVTFHPGANTLTVTCNVPDGQDSIQFEIYIHVNAIEIEETAIILAIPLLFAAGFFLFGGDTDEEEEDRRRGRLAPS